MLTKASNMLLSIKIQTDYLKSLTEPLFNNFWKNFNETYVFDNAEIFDLFFLLRIDPN